MVKVLCCLHTLYKFTINPFLSFTKIFLFEIKKIQFDIIRDMCHFNPDTRKELHLSSCYNFLLICCREWTVSPWLYFFICLEEQIMILKLLTFFYFLEDWNGMEASRREVYLGKKWGSK